MGPPERIRLSEPMPPGTDQVLSAVSPLVARCATFEAASRTVEYLYSCGVPREALSVVADGVQPAAAAIHVGQWLHRGTGSSARRRMPGSIDAEPVMSRRYYVTSDQGSAQRARRLLCTGANAQGETFGVDALPCVGQLSARSLHPSSGLVRIKWWSRRARPRWVET